MIFEPRCFRGYTLDAGVGTDECLVSEGHDVFDLVIDPFVEVSLCLVCVPFLGIRALIHDFSNEVTLTSHQIVRTSKSVLSCLPFVEPSLLIFSRRQGDLAHENITDVEGLDVHHGKGVGLLCHTKVNDLVI